MLVIDEILNLITAEIRLLEDPRKALVVFDLDSTLFDVSTRTQAILRAFIDDPGMQIRFPEECRQLINIQTVSTDWGLKSTLHRAQVKGTITFFETIKNYWIEHFFSNRFLDYDRPYDRALELVNSVFNTGTQILYLTGREQSKMATGSEAVLKKWGFPLRPPEAQLKLKPTPQLGDSEFKKNVLLDLVSNHPQIWLIENEPVIINLVQEHCPTVKIVLVDSVHSGKAEAPLEILKIPVRRGPG